LFQVELTLNVLHSSRVNPKLLAYAYYLNGHFDFNKTPLAPPGTKVVIHTKQTNTLLGLIMVKKAGMLGLPWSIIGACNVTSSPWDKLDMSTPYNHSSRKLSLSPKYQPTIT
jgi:hypothetical protein